MNLAIIGTGYVGLATGTCLAEMGNQVICVDNDLEKIQKMQSGIIPFYEPGLEIIFHRNISKGRLLFTSDLKKAFIESEIVFFCLPTPQGEDGSADLSYVIESAGKIGIIAKEENIQNYKIIVNKSTVPVGTAKLVEEEIKKHGYNNFDVVSNPEFLREGFAVSDFMKPDRIVIGSESKKALTIMKELYEPFVRQGNPIIEMDTASAEVTKYAANSYLAMRITFMNELANFCEKVGADIDLVRKGMGSDSRIGKRFLFAGIGYGGSCFPKDVKALIKTSIEKGSEITLLSVVDKVNTSQKLILFKKILEHFNSNIKDKHFAIWGLAFKPNTDDMREAPSVVIINELLKYGATVSAYDPAAMETAKYYLGDKIKYATNEIDALKNSDALVLLTEWNEFRNPNFDEVKRHLKTPLIFDGRNVYSPDKMKELGFTYYSIGRLKVN